VIPKKRKFQFLFWFPATACIVLCAQKQMRCNRKIWLTRNLKPSEPHKPHATTMRKIYYSQKRKLSPYAIFYGGQKTKAFFFPSFLHNQIESSVFTFSYRPALLTIQYEKAVQLHADCMIPTFSRTDTDTKTVSILCLHGGFEIHSLLSSFLAIVAYTKVRFMTRWDMYTWESESSQKSHIVRRDIVEKIKLEIWVNSSWRNQIVCAIPRLQFGLYIKSSSSMSHYLCLCACKREFSWVIFITGNGERMNYTSKLSFREYLVKF